MRDGDNDIAAALPKAPPPSPARRMAAIEEAMRRFDGIEATPADGQRRAEPRRASWWAALGRPQFAGLVSATLVAVVGMPVAWYAIDRESTPGIVEPGSDGVEVAQPGTAQPPVKTATPPQPAGRQAAPPPSMAPAAPSAENAPPPPMAAPQAPTSAPALVLADGNRQAANAEAAKEVGVTRTNLRGVPDTSGAAEAAKDVGVTGTIPRGTPPSGALEASRDVVVTGTSTRGSPPSGAAEASRDVVVTGTNIRGVAPTGSNLTARSKEDIAATGQTNAGQLLATIPGFSDSNAVPNNGGAAATKAAPANAPRSPAPPPPPRAAAPPPPPPAPSRAAPAPPPPPPAARAENVAPAEARRQAGRGASAASARGDWNACTVNDPRKNLGTCTALVNPAASGTEGRAAARLADGLSRAWQGDFAGAVTAFDAAIALSPQLAFAWLNRGLAWQHRGDLDRALADLNQAVRYAPAAARGYYSRSLLLRQRGDARGASADEKRAVELDARYKALIE